MSRIVYVNGDFLPEADAKISVFDRGWLFADGVYEVIAVIDGQLIDNAAHLRRLRASLDALSLTAPCSTAELIDIQRQTLRRNRLSLGMLYLQITRGAADRDFAFPTQATPSLVMFTQRKDLIHNPLAQRGIRILGVPDIRWRRRDIKTTGLLAAAMAKQTALEAGADDAWLIEDGLVTEGSAANAYIVTQDRRLVTRSLGPEILAGVTRQAVLQLAAEHQLSIEQRPFSLTEAQTAREAFNTAATSLVLPVVAINGTPIGDGQPGPMTRRLRALYIESVRGRIQ